MFSKLFSRSQQRNEEDLRIIRFVMKRFGYRPKNVRLFYEAVTHKSFSNLTENETSNERLEYLGDAVLDAVVAELLFLKFPDKDEGFLTKIKSKVVSRKTLSEIGEELRLREIIRYHKGRTINLSSLEGNCFEAMLGAIYLDGGFEAVKRCINHNILRNYADLNKILEEEIDFKSKLFIWSQKKHLSLDFVIVKEECTAGNWMYEVIVHINEMTYGKGSGSSKKQAEQMAAKETLILMGEL